MKTIKAIVVEDEIIIRMYIVRALIDLGCEIVGETSTGEEAINLSLSRTPDVIFMDVKLAGKINGVEAVRTIRENCRIPVVFLSAFEANISPDMTDIYFADKPVNTFALEDILLKIKAKHNR